MLYRFPANYYNPGSSDCQPVGNGMTLSAQDIVGLDILYPADEERIETILEFEQAETVGLVKTCLLYTSPSPRDLSTSRMPSSA